MSADVADYRDLLVEIAGPVRLGENVKAVLARIARKTGLTDRRVRSIWHGEVRDLRARELAALLRATRDAKALEEAIEERTQLLRRIAACEAALGLRPSDQTGEGHHAASPARGRTDRSMAPGE